MKIQKKKLILRTEPNLITKKKILKIKNKKVVEAVMIFYAKYSKYELIYWISHK